MLRTTLLTAVVVCIITSCNNTNKNNNTATNTSAQTTTELVFEQKTITRQEGRCTGDAACVKTNIVYPQATGNNEAAKNINTLIEKTVASFLTVGETSPTNIQTGLDEFFKSYNEFAKSTPETLFWSLTADGKVIAQTPQNVTVQIYGYSFTGGAHPISMLSYLNFDAKTGNQLKLTDFVADTTTLKQLAEKKFREQNQLAPNASLEEAGFMFPDNKFILPANIALAKDSLLLYYNPYEIASYAQGPTKMAIAYTELGNVIKK